MEKGNSQEFYFEIPAKKTDNSIMIDTDFMLYLLDFFKSLDSQSQEAKQNSVAHAFKEKVRTIWSDCLAHGPRPWENKDNIIGEALFVDYTFDKEKLAMHAEEIYKLISFVHTATTYEEMKFLDNGEKWSELRQPVSFLMALGNALKLVDFKNDRTTWDEEEKKNPELTFTLTK